jgi:cell division protein ZapA
VAEDKNRVQVKIMEHDYYLKVKQPPEHLQKVAAYVDRKMLQISKSYPNLSSLNVAVLAALNITDELFGLQSEIEEFLKTMNEGNKK